LAFLNFLSTINRKESKKTGASEFLQFKLIAAIQKRIQFFYPGYLFSMGKIEPSAPGHV